MADRMSQPSSSLATQVVSAFDVEQPAKGKGHWYRIVHSTAYVYGIILFQGLAQLISSGALLNSSHFFISHAKESGIQGSLVMDYLLTVLCFSKVLFLVLGHILFQICCFVEPIVHILYSLLAKTVIFSIFAWIAYQDNLSGAWFIAVTLILAFLGSFMSVVSFMGCYCFLATMKPLFSQALCIGQTSAGVIMSLVKVLLILSASEDAEELDIALYFLITAVATLLSAIIFLTIRKSRKDPKFAYIPPEEVDTGPPVISVDQKAELYQPQPKKIFPYDSPSNVSGSLSATSNNPQETQKQLGLIKNVSIDNLLMVRSFAESPFQINTWKSVRRRMTQDATKPAPSPDEENQAPISEKVPAATESQCRKILRLLNNNFSFYLCILVHFAQSLFLVPNFCYITKANHISGVLYTEKMFPVFSYFLYHVAEWCGKLILVFENIRCKNLSIIWVSVMAIFGMYPLFMMGNVPIVLSLVGRHGDPWIPSDEFFLVMLCVFGLVHGYISTCLVMMTPEIQASVNLAATPDPAAQEIVSTLVVYCISIGLFLGSLLSLGFKVLLLNV